jgi:hypothetical protein
MMQIGLVTGVALALLAAGLVAVLFVSLRLRFHVDPEKVRATRDAASLWRPGTLPPGAVLTNRGRQLLRLFYGAVAVWILAMGLLAVNASGPGAWPGG